MDARVRDAAFGASYELAHLRGSRELLPAVATTLGGLIPSDVTGWVSWTAGKRSVDSRWPEDPQVRSALNRRVERAEHPVLRAIRSGRGSQPMRISDLVDADHRHGHPVFDDLHRLMGVSYQLTIPSASPTGARVSVWGLHRESPDFTDEEVRIAAALMPLLSLLDGSSVSATDPSTDLLTPREVQILRLLASGATAAHIGYLERISAATVNKHIQHIYAKLAVHDRVTAVRTGVRLGLIPE
jgi:DNA-binding CsgD family transcriptional regulator